MQTKTISERPQRRIGYTVPHAAEELDCSQATVWRLIKDGRLKVFRLRGGVRVTAESLHRLAEGH